MRVENYYIFAYTIHTMLSNLNFIEKKPILQNNC